MSWIFILFVLMIFVLISAIIYFFTRGSWVGPGILAMIFVGLIFTGTLQDWAKAQEAQVERAQRNRQAFVDRCFLAGGHILDFRKSTVSRMCVGRDGRILESY